MMCCRRLLVAFTINFIFSMAAGAKNLPVAFQTGAIAAFQEGAYDGTLSCKELLQHGDFGLGAFAGIDGEMLVLNGEVWRINAEGHASRASLKDMTSFGIITSFKGSKKIALTNVSDMPALTKLLDQSGISLNKVMAIRIEGRFDFIKTRAIPLQHKPYRRLAELAKTQPTFEFRGRKGTLIGFRYPSFMSGLNVPGYHFHFLTAEHDGGGHVLEFRGLSGSAEVEKIDRIEISLPSNESFEKANLSAPTSDELRAIEGGR